MMTTEMMKKAIEALGEDATTYTIGTTIHVTLEDFEGFSEDWDEIDREFDDEAAVDYFLEMLEDTCTSCEGDYYRTFHFEGFDVELGYASFDI